MAKNKIQVGDILTVTAPYAVSSGDGVLVGSIFGVAQTDALIGADVAIDLRGVYELPKLTADVVTQGEDLYWDDGTKELTTSLTGNTPAGKATAAAGGAVSLVYCRLNG